MRNLGFMTGVLVGGLVVGALTGRSAQATNEDRYRMQQVQERQARALEIIAEELRRCK